MADSIKKEEVLAFGDFALYALMLSFCLPSAALPPCQQNNCNISPLLFLTWESIGIWSMARILPL